MKDPIKASKPKTLEDVREEALLRDKNSVCCNQKKILRYIIEHMKGLVMKNYQMSMFCVNCHKLFTKNKQTRDSEKKRLLKSQITKEKSMNI